MTDHRQEIYEAISEMLDSPDEYGIYPTTKCYDRLEAYCNSLTVQTRQTVLTKALQEISDKARKFVPGSGDESFHEGLRSQARIADVVLVGEGQSDD